MANEIGVVEPGHALAGSGSVSAANDEAGSLGFVGGQEVMKLDAIVKAWLRPRGVCVSFNDVSGLGSVSQPRAKPYVEWAAPCTSLPDRGVDPCRMARFG